jgi:hypothetical protein
LLIPKNTEEALELGKKLPRKEILCYWKEYKRSLSDQRLVRKLLKRSFREQMLRETLEGYLGTDGHHSLTPKQIDEKLYGKSNNKNESM